MGPKLLLIYSGDLQVFSSLNLVSTATSKQDKDSDCFIQIIFTLKSRQGEIETVNLEMSMQEFNEFYKEMDKINSMIEIVC